MIDLLVAITENTSTIKLPVRGIYPRCHRLGIELLSQLVAVPESHIEYGLNLEISSFFLAFSWVLLNVRIDLLGGNSSIDNILERVVHLTTIAPIISIGEGAVHYLLGRKVRQLVSGKGIQGLQISDGGECIASPAKALISDSGHNSLLPPIDWQRIFSLFSGRLICEPLSGSVSFCGLLWVLSQRQVQGLKFFRTQIHKLVGR